MIELLLIALISILLTIILLGIRFQKTPYTDGPRDDGKASPKDELQSLAFDLEFPGLGVGAGIFDQRDWEFISREAPSLKSAFARDRTRLAKVWLKENRIRMSQLLHLHRMIVRTSENLSVRSELKIASGFLFFQAMLLVAEVLVSMGGAFRVRSLCISTVAAFEYVSDTVGRSVMALDPAQKAAIRDDWARAS